MSKHTATDLIHRFLFDDANIRGEIVSLSKSYQNAVEHQNLPLPAKTLLGEFLTAACLLSEILKFDGTLTIQVRGSGNIPLIMAEATNKKNLRGIVKLGDGVTAEDLSQKTLPEIIGSGVLTLTMDPEQGKRYQGIIALEGDTLADCLTAYFVQSEQLPTRIWLFANESFAGGLLLQSLPPQAPAVHDPEQWNTAVQLANTITSNEMFELEHASVLTRLFHEFDVRLFEPSQVAFSCKCSPERCANSISALGKEDAFALIAERDIIEMNCEFCGTQYIFGEQDLTELFATSEQKPNLH